MPSEKSSTTMEIKKLKVPSCSPSPLERSIRATDKPDIIYPPSSLSRLPKKTMMASRDIVLKESLSANENEDVHDLERSSGNDNSNDFDYSNSNIETVFVADTNKDDSLGNDGKDVSASSSPAAEEDKKKSKSKQKRQNRFSSLGKRMGSLSLGMKERSRNKSKSPSHDNQSNDEDVPLSNDSEVNVDVTTQSPSKILIVQERQEGQETTEINAHVQKLKQNNDSDSISNSEKKLLHFPDTQDLIETWGNDRIQFINECIIPHKPDPHPSPPPLTKKEKKALTKSMKSTSTRELPPPVPVHWSVISGSNFKVRAGPNYSKNKNKLPSESSLYETVHCCAFASAQRTPQTTLLDCFPLPLHHIFPNKTLPTLHDPRVPHLLILHFQLPYEQPNMFNKTIDGNGGEIIFYLLPNQKFCDESNAHFSSSDVATTVTKSQTLPKPEENQAKVSNATKLFTEWCTKCEASLEWRSRFKCMALVRDLEKHGINMLKPYNGKPVLITESGRAKRIVTNDGIRVLEMSANVHKWGFLAKKGFVSILSKFKVMGLELGFTIEAFTDDEMPECMLGSILVNCLDPMKLTAIPTAFQKSPAS